METLQQLAFYALDEAGFSGLVSATDQVDTQPMHDWITDSSVVYRPDIASAAEAGAGRGKKKKGKKSSKTEKNGEKDGAKDVSAEDTMFSDVLDSVGGGEGTGGSASGTKHMEFTFKIDPVKYAARFGISIPDDSSDLSISEDSCSCGCCDGGSRKIEGSAQDAVVRYSGNTGTWGRQQCQATLEECRARNPMTCRFHGTQAIAHDIEQSLRNAGVQGDVTVEFLGTDVFEGRQMLTVKASVDARADQTDAVERAMQEFYRNPGVINGTNVFEENGGRSSLFDIDMLDPNARADWGLRDNGTGAGEGHAEVSQPGPAQESPEQAEAEDPSSPTPQPISETTAPGNQQNAVQANADDLVQRALEAARNMNPGGFVSAAALRDAIEGARNGNEEDIAYLTRKLGENSEILREILGESGNRRDEQPVQEPAANTEANATEHSQATESPSQEPVAERHPESQSNAGQAAEGSIPQNLLDDQSAAEAALSQAEAELAQAHEASDWARQMAQGAPAAMRQMADQMYESAEQRVRDAIASRDLAQTRLSEATAAIDAERQRQEMQHIPVYPSQYVDADGTAHQIEHGEGGIKARVTDSELAAVERMKGKAFGDAANGVDGAEEYAHAVSRFLGRGTENAPGLRSKPEKYRLLEKMESRLNDKSSAVETAEREHGRDSEEFQDALADFKATQQAVRDIAGVLNVRPNDCVGDNCAMTRAAIESMTAASGGSQNTEAQGHAPGTTEVPQTSASEQVAAATGATVSADGNTVTVPAGNGGSSAAVSDDAIQRHVGGAATNVQDNRSQGGDITFTLPGSMSQAEVDAAVARLQEQYGDGFLVTATRNGDGTSSVQMRPAINTDSAQSFFTGLTRAGVGGLGGGTIDGTGGNFTMTRNDHAWDDSVISAIQSRMPDHEVRQEQNSNGDWIIRISPRARSQAEQAVGNTLADAIRENQESQAASREGDVSRHGEGRGTGAAASGSTQVRDQDINAHVNSALSRLVSHWGGHSDRILRGLNDALNGNANADVDTYLNEAEGVLGENDPVVQAIRNRINQAASSSSSSRGNGGHTRHEDAGTTAERAPERPSQQQTAAPSQAGGSTSQTGRQRQIEGERHRQLESSQMHVGQRAVVEHEIEQTLGANTTADGAEAVSRSNARNIGNANPTIRINSGHIRDAIVMKYNLENEARRLREAGDEDSAVINENAARAISTFSRRDGGMAQRGEDGQFNQTNRSVVDHMVSYLKRARGRAAERHGNDPATVRGARGVKGVERAITAMGAALGFTPQFTNSGVTFDWGDGSSSTVNFDQVGEWQPSQRQPRSRQTPQTATTTPSQASQRPVSRQEASAQTPPSSTPATPSARQSQNQGAAQRLEQAMANVQSPAARAILERIRTRAQNANV